MKQEKVLKIMEILEREFPDPVPALDHKDAFTLLVAVILSAQCTDVRVNMVTPNLFGKMGCNEGEMGVLYDSPEKILELGEEGLKKIIKSCGFYNAKARNIMGMCHGLIEKYDGKVPDILEELVELPGVGRKTASVILCQWFRIPAVPVDTHVHRISNRLGLVNGVLGPGGTKTPEKTEMALREVLPRDKWIDGHLQIIFHGRKTCTARRPKCMDCPLWEFCEWEGKSIG
ncbi:endonuclease III [Candidatus Peregrinibacteria bacterium]|jgi:endonuclease III|nr:endonuclease III [Candidatus Peregrinibacteria bacterium]